jgi:hypothetical protein
MRPSRTSSDNEPDVLWSHGGSATKTPADSRLIQIHFLAQGFQKLWRGEQTGDFSMLEQRDPLIHHMDPCKRAPVRIAFGQSLSLPNAESRSMK